MKEEHDRLMLERVLKEFVDAAETPEKKAEREALMKEALADPEKFRSEYREFLHATYGDNWQLVCSMLYSAD